MLQILNFGSNLENFRKQLVRLKNLVNRCCYIYFKSDKLFFKIC